MSGMCVCAGVDFLMDAFFAGLGALVVWVWVLDFELCSVMVGSVDAVCCVLHLLVVFLCGFAGGSCLLAGVLGRVCVLVWSMWWMRSWLIYMRWLCASECRILIWILW